MSAEHTPQQAELAKVPQILAILVQSEQISAEQQQAVVAALRNPENNGKFAGEIAVGMNFVSQEQVDAGLRFQSKLMAEAAVKDLQDIAIGTPLTFPPYLKPHWGNGDGVNAISDPVTIDSAASAAANVAKLITLLVKDKPELAEYAKEGVVAAKNLTNYILEGNSDICPGNKHAANWLSTARETLRTVAEGEPKLSQYIENRFTEMGRGVYLAQAREAAPIQEIGR